MPNTSLDYRTDPPVSLKEGDTYLYSKSNKYIIRIILYKYSLGLPTYGLPPYALAEFLDLNNNEVFVQHINIIGLFEENENVYFIGNLKSSIRKDILPYK